MSDFVFQTFFMATIHETFQRISPLKRQKQSKILMDYSGLTATLADINEHWKKTFKFFCFVFGRKFFLFSIQYRNHSRIYIWRRGEKSHFFCFSLFIHQIHFKIYYWKKIVKPNKQEKNCIFFKMLNKLMKNSSFLIIITLVI